MISLFCDLDNTIIYSHRRKLNTPKRVTEVLNGAPQSYMTERTYEFLSDCRKVTFIPVTTRTFSQYVRLQSTMESLNCEYALILNGAVLLKNGTIDKEWLTESKELIKNTKAEMGKVARLINNNNMVLRYRDDFLVYASSSNPEESATDLMSKIDDTKVHVFFDSRKVYCVPVLLDKGLAVKRLLKRLHPELTIAVGDSENDISMFESVEIPIVPQSLELKVTNDRKIVVPEFEILSDVACCEIEKIVLGK